MVVEATSIPAIIEERPTRTRRPRSTWTIEGFNSLVRPIVTLGLVLGFIWRFMDGTIPSESYIPVVMLVVGFWFGERKAKNEKPEPEQ